MVTSSALHQLIRALHGHLIRTEDPGYNVARALRNGMIDKKPAFIVGCRDVTDIIAAANFAREQGLELSVRGGGHNVAGLAGMDQELMVDLSGMRGVEINRKTSTVLVQGGCSLGRCRPGNPVVWPGNARRYHINNGCRWVDTWWGVRLVKPWPWLEH